MNKGTLKDSRVNIYLNRTGKQVYVNTKEEDELVQAWNTKYLIAKSEYEKSRVGTAHVTVWRNAYMGDFKALDIHGKATENDLKAIRKLAYELVEQKVDSVIPAPKMSPRFYSDIVPVNSTEDLLKHEMNKMLSEETHDESEHSTLIDSTSWFKVSWNPFDNTHQRSGMPMVEVCPIDRVYPQPGVTNYKRLEYIFERSTVSLATLFDLYGRWPSATEDDMVNVVECYYLNENRYVGKIVWVEDTLTVLTNDVEWTMRKRRECTRCSTVVPIASECPLCSSKSFAYRSVKTEILDKELVWVENPYRSGESVDIDEDETEATNSLPVGTIIPHYLIRQLPYVPKRSTKLSGSIYGISEVELNLEVQDLINKLLNKAEKKSLQSKTYVTKMKDTRVNTEQGEITFLEVESAQEAASMQVKQVTADITQELVMSNTLYDTAKSTAGVTDTDQGKNDPSARSGKAKQMQLAASQQRQSAPKAQRNIAYAGVYELIFKYLLAFCDEERSFVKILPDGTKREEVWSKYMFLDKDKDGDLYYRDDFAWSIDDASAITNDRAAMWQLIDNDYLSGTMGNEIDPIRAMRMYWHMKDQAGYPTAKFALAFLDDAVQKLPTQIEQALVNNPDAVELAMSYLQDMNSGGGAGGARDGAGKPNNGQTHEQQQDKANMTKRAEAGQETNTTATKTGGMSGGTGNDKN